MYSMRMGIFSKEKKEEKIDDRPKSHKEIIKKIEIFTQGIERVYPSTGRMLWRSFLQGLFFSLGTTIGLSIVLASLTFIFSQLSNIPSVKNILNRTHIEQILPIERSSEK